MKFEFTDGALVNKVMNFRVPQKARSLLCYCANISINRLGFVAET
jgi:hypothetical protein